MVIDPVSLFLLLFDVPDDVMQVNQVYVDSRIVQGYPPILTVLPFHSSKVFGKPVPVTLTVVPPPILPSEGSLENI